MKIKNIVKNLFTLGVLGLFAGMFLTTPWPEVSASVPAEYKPNYKFATQREKIEETMYNISALKKNGQAINTSLFSSLLSNFNIVFNYLPQNKPEYKEVYASCRVNAEELSKKYSISQFSLFQNNCFDPLLQIFNDITENNSVIANIKARPTSWPAPLTVTFNWGDSVDSSATIPSNGYFWYFIDVDWAEKPLWKWQWQIVNHTFENQWRYTVFLTARSRNEWAKGIFDWKKSMVINVTPHIANIIITANGKKMDEFKPLKFTSQEASDGIILDGSKTMPEWWSVIQKHLWTIFDAISKKKISETNGMGVPSSLKEKFPEKWYYTVKLEVTDNTNNVVSKSFSLIIADPIAQIKVTPAEGNTSSLYSFDASTSYSVQSTLKSYLWIVSDAEWNEILREKSKNIQHRFAQPGTYRVRLQVIDQLWNENEDSETIDVESTPPVPQFTMEPTKKRRLASEYWLDASSSYDIDTPKWNDFITYNWAFSNNENVNILETLEEGKKIKVSFKEKWNYQITLSLKDNFGQIQEISRTIKIESSLKPEITVAPIASKLWIDTAFHVKSNKQIVNYSWDFGDGETRIIQENKIVHRYKKAWTQRAKLSVSTADWETNDIIALVYIWEANEPIPVYSVLNQNWEFLLAEGNCKDDKWETNVSYKVLRYQQVSINTYGSVNTKWWNENLAIYFKPQWGNIIRNNQLTYKFDELWCHFIDMEIEDTAVNKTASKRIWFDIENAPPTLQNLVMTFPQVGNSFGIGIWQNTQNTDVFKADIDPVILRLDVTNGRDSDWSIVSYKRYYYNVDDPNRILEIKYTPSTIPYAYFTVPRLYGEYRFAVEITDNDGMITNSEMLLGKWPVVFFPPSTTTPDIPIVTLKIDKPNAKVWEIITLETIAKIGVERSDFASQRRINYDFEWDGVRDMTTKDTKVTYVYKKTGTFSPRVKVTYRGRSGIATAERIDIEKWVKAWFLYATVWKTLIVRDASYGDIENRKFCADARECKTNPNWLIENQTYFKKDYPEPGKYVVRYNIQASNGETSAQNDIIEIKDTPESPNSIGIVTLPSPSKDGKVVIGNALENKILFYVAYNGSWDCYIDTDISSDSKNTGTPDQNNDISCNTTALFEYKNQYMWSTIARVYFWNWDQLLSKDIPIEFIDFNMEIPNEKKEIYTLINKTIDDMPAEQPEIKSILLLLRNAIMAGDETSSLVLQLKDIYENRKEEISISIKQQLDTILSTLADKTTISALWGTTYETSKQSIFSAMPTSRRAEVEDLFLEIENAAGDNEKIKTNLLKIPDIWNEEVKKWALTEADMDYITKEVCKIVAYYNISWTSCKNQDWETIWDTKNEPWIDTAWTSIAKTILKRVLVVVWIIWSIFIALVIVFAIKAKNKEKAQ